MKCEECGKTLGLGNYAALSGKYYCKPHFKQLFALKGNYSEGFGEEKPTAKWQPKGDATPSSSDDQSPAHTDSPAAEEAPHHEEAHEEAHHEEAHHEEAHDEEAHHEEAPAADE